MGVVATFREKYNAEGCAYTLWRIFLVGFQFEVAEAKEPIPCGNGGGCCDFGQSTHFVWEVRFPDMGVPDAQPDPRWVYAAQGYMAAIGDGTTQKRVTPQSALTT